MKFILFFILILSNAYSFPEYEKPNLEMSSSFTSGYNAPPLSLFTNSTPTINDSRNIGITMGLIDGQDISGIWTKINGKVTFPYFRNDSFKISDFVLSEKNKFFISVHQEGFFVDLLKIELSPNGGKKVSSLKEIVESDLGFENLTSTKIARDGVMFKGFKKDKGLYLLKSNLDLVELELENKNYISYLFSPSFNFSGSAAYKIRLGLTGDYNESAPDQIILNNRGAKTIIDQDRNSDKNSRWVSFRNGVGVNNKNEVSYVAIDKKGKAHIVVSSPSSGKRKIIISEGKDISKITYFAPLINDQGLVAFRAQNLKGKHGVYVTDGNTLKEVFVEGQVLKTSIGQIEIGALKSVPFGGNIGFNNLGDIVINSSILDPVTRNFLGRALISVYSK